MSTQVVPKSKRARHNGRTDCGHSLANERASVRVNDRLQLVRRTDDVFITGLRRFTAKIAEARTVSGRLLQRQSQNAKLLALIRFPDPWGRAIPLPMIRQPSAGV